MLHAIADYQRDLALGDGRAGGEVDGFKRLGVRSRGEEGNDHCGAGVDLELELLSFGRGRTQLLEGRGAAGRGEQRLLPGEKLGEHGWAAAAGH